LYGLSSWLKVMTRCLPTVCIVLARLRRCSWNTDVEEDAAAWDVEIDHTFTPRCDGSGAVLVVATITATLLLQSGAHLALYH